MSSQLPLVVVFGGCFFAGFNFLLTEITSKTHSWKFRNIATSLLHSTITGLAAPVNLFYLSPQILTDLIDYSSEVLLLTLAFSVGYFIYDAVDMYVNNPKTSTYQLLGHHFCVIVCFAISLYTRKYIGCASICMVLELNSIFLHIRQLMVIEEVDRGSRAFRAIAVLNMATFIAFRIVVVAWMVLWILANAHRLPVYYVSLALFGFGTLTTMNVSMLVKLVQRDFLGRPDNTEMEEKGHAANGVTAATALVNKQD